MPQPLAGDNYKAVLFIFFLLWLFWSPDTGPNFPSATDLAKQRLEKNKAALDVLNSSRWTDFSPVQTYGWLEETEPTWLNITGFRKNDSYAWHDLGRWRDLCLRWSRHAIPPVGGEDLWDKAAGEPVWQNVSGLVHGTWVRETASVIRGWSSYNLSGIAPLYEWSNAKESWARNITGQEGKMILKLDEKKAELEYEELSGEGFPKSGGRVRGAKALVTIEDSAGSGMSWQMRLHGVHWPKQGTLLMTTTSEKFDGIFGLPHLSPSPDFFQSSQRILNETVYKALAAQENRLFSDTAIPWTSDLENPGDTLNPSPHCEYVLYAQIHPPDRDQLDMTAFNGKVESMAGIISDIEQELRHPRGAPIRGIPELKMSAIIWSPDCGFFLETKGPPLYAPPDGQHLVGMKAEVVLYETKVWILAYTLVLFAQVYFLRLQIKESFTPSTIGRISYLTMAVMLIADGLVFAGSSAWVIPATNTLLPSLAVVFGSFLSMTIGGTFLAEIHRVQEPLWRRRARDQAPSNNPTPTAPTPASEAIDSLPRPVTAGPPREIQTTPPRIIIPSDQDIDAEIAEQTSGAAAVTTRVIQTPPPRPAPEWTFSTVVARMIGAGLAVMFLMILATSWGPRLSSAFFNAMAFLYLSFWVPQIHRNIIRNCRRALNWRFMIGQSVLRLLPLSYFYMKEENFLLTDPDRTAFAVFCAWVWIQLWVLAFQDVLGPRFGIPKSWTPDAWDYHPILREDSLEAGGLPIGLVSAPGSPTLERVKTEEERDRDKEKDKGRKKGQTRVIDCAICREDLEVPVVRVGDEDPSAGGVVGVFTRRQYMVTPCRHIFHSACLEGWMRFRLQCPICREELPPL
jgi:transmembrane E3 ubiquitin-protein ligase